MFHSVKEIPGIQLRVGHQVPVIVQGCCGHPEALQTGHDPSIVESDCPVTDKTIIPQATALAWVVFCCPPYAFYHDRWEELEQLLSQCQRLAPAGSLLIVESDLNFATDALPLPETWDTRSYSPAQVSVHTVSDSSGDKRG